MNLPAPSAVSDGRFTQDPAHTKAKSRENWHTCNATSLEVLKLAVQVIGPSNPSAAALTAYAQDLYAWVTTYDPNEQGPT